MTNYYDRIKNLCEEYSINSSGFLFDSHGNVKPLIQNLNTNKLKRNFPGILFT